MTKESDKGNILMDAIADLIFITILISVPKEGCVNIYSKLFRNVATCKRKTCEHSFRKFHRSMGKSHTFLWKLLVVSIFQTIFATRKQKI